LPSSHWMEMRIGVAVKKNAPMNRPRSIILPRV
jgi:hypothetical protein